jgi:hypothetical protein
MRHSDFYFVLVYWCIFVIGFPSATGSIIYAILQVLIFKLTNNSWKIWFVFPPNPTQPWFLFSQIVITGVGAALIDRAGRKPLLLVNLKLKQLIFIFICLSPLHVWYSYCYFLVSIRYLDQDWLQDVYLQQLHSISRYIPTKNFTASSF